MRLHELFDLSGSVAIITGGSRGLGFQIAEALGEFGARVVLVARKEAELVEATQMLTAAGIAAEYVVGDLASAVGVNALIEEIAAKTASVDILVNCAGATWGAPAAEYPEDAWNKVINLNLTSLFRLTQAVAVRWMLPRSRGAVLNIASIEGLQAHHKRQPGTVAYNASKGAVINMTRALAAEWGEHGIRVNALAPGFFPTKMTTKTIEAFGDALLDNTPLGKLGGADDLKGAALLLASRAGGHITGQVIVVDGGATII
jgi:gluconate 5-dehydrogenase